MSSSDDFSSSVLDSVWVIEGPSGIDYALDGDGTEAWLELVTPDGNYDVWGSNNGARAMQAVDDVDMVIETRFLSTPTGQYQLQGLLFEQDADNWIRFDTYSDGSRLYAFAAVTIDGVSSARFQVRINGGSAPYLRVARDGDVWTMEYSTNGTAWVTAGSFTQSLDLSAAGVVAGNTGNATGFTAQVDYFEIDSDPLVVEDPVALGGNTAPAPQDDALSTLPDTQLVISTEDLLGNDEDANGDTLSIVSVGPAANGTLTDNGDGTWTYQPNAGYTGADSFSYTVSDGTDTSDATVTLTVAAEAQAISDDFSAATLDSVWRIEGPAGISHALSADGTDAWLELITPDGNYDVWGTNNGARAMQDVADDDMVVETRFLTTPTGQYQLQGLLFEEDSDTWIRFDTYSDGSKLYAFAAVTIDGTTSSRVQVRINGGSAPYLRVSRDGDVWTMEYSTNGATWVTAGSFTQAIELTAAGVVAGNTGNATGFTAQVDYFEIDSDPLLTEDDGIVPLDPGDDAFVTAADAALVVSTDDLLANDGSGQTLTVTSVGTPGHGTLTANGDGTWTYQPTTGYQGYDSFSYTVSNGQSEASATVTVTVGTPPTPAFVSDDFNTETLGDTWTVIAPSGSSQGLETDGAEAYLTLTTGTGSHDIWNTNNAVRAMQEVADENFMLEARFLSTPTAQYQMQGFVIEESESTWLRFDTYSDGTKLWAFGAVTVNGVSSQAFKVQVVSGSAPYLRLERDGDTFRLYHSQDGSSWISAGTLTRAMTVTEAGVFAGSAGSAGSFTAEVDYVSIDSDPIVFEDGVSAAPVAGDDAFATDADTALIVSADDLLANDSDPDGDTLTVVSVGTPEHGSLTDNGDGTWTYQPDIGYEGYDGFTYVVTDGGTEVTGTVTLTVGTPPIPRFASDDFNVESLSLGWTLVEPAGTDVELTGNTEHALLELSTSNGNYDLWGTTRNAVRVMQEISDEDLALEVGFLGAPSVGHQMQGFLLEEDSSNWLRYDLYSDGQRVYAFAAVTVNGVSSQVMKVAVTSDVRFLRIERVGNTFTFLYSNDEDGWVTAGSVQHAMELTQAGLFAGSVGSSSAISVLVDYVQADTDLIGDEDLGYLPPPAPPVAVDDYLSTDPGTALAFTADDLLANDTDINEDTLTITSISTPGSGTITDLGGGNYLYTPNTGFEGLDSFTYVVSDGTYTDEGTVSVLVDTFDAVSDDFSGGSLDPAWQFSGIAGTAYLAYDDDDAMLAIVSPAGVQVSASDVMTTPRMLQDVPDMDFQISAGFLSEPAQRYQEHGLLVVQDDENWIRFDLAYTGGTLTLIVGMIVGGQTTYPLFQSIGSGVVEDLRITREGDAWTFEYRGGGSGWVEAFTYDREMTVSQVGLFAGSTSFTGAVPGYTAYVDYFENSLQPITDEDGSYVPSSHAPVAVDDIIGLTDSVTFDASDLLANDYDPNLDDTLTVVALGSVSHGTLTDNGDGTWTYEAPVGYEGNDTLSYTISDGSQTASATVTFEVRQPIDVWYGDVQSFGTPGDAQTAINILGSVESDVVSLSYSLNGGTLRELSIGADTRRLQNEGDFNIDLDYAELDGSSADDVITIYATLTNGTVFTTDVTVEYESGNIWDANYSIDWSTVTNLQDVVQVVDGTWNWDADGARPVDLGYDRLLVLGDDSWDNYELSLTITGHDFENVDPRGRDGGAFAIGMLWGGHTDEPISGWQPRSGYEPGAAFFYTDELTSHSYHSFSQKLGSQALTLSEEVEYNVTVRVEQTGLYDRIYSFKIWEAGTAEPTGWTLQTLETFSIDEAPATGGIYLNAHYYDVTFGDITVTEITGSDIIQGDDTAEVLVAVDTGAALPGAGEIDVFVGAGGADVFVFGDATRAYYDDGIAASDGTGDYGYVWDFEVGTDTVQLFGSASDYLLAEGREDLPNGTSIWLLGEGTDEDELIAVLGGVSGLSLEGDSFTYVGAIA